MKYSIYVISTILYGLVGLFSIMGGFYFSVEGNWFLVLICGLMLYVSIDNFFCGSRLHKTGTCDVHSHYVVPPFIKNLFKK